MQVKEVLRVKGNRLVSAEPAGRAVEAFESELGCRAGVERHDWQLDDPKGKTIERVGGPSIRIRLEKPGSS